MDSSGRVREYVESTARSQSGRGLRIPEGMDIIVIYTNKGNPGIIDQPERDEKNMMRTKEKRPRHPMQEDIESLPLYLNPVLEPLALCLCARYVL
ncbi:hypothetical protein I7I53_07658 [Histoplasma capsulatum var. duboisii H88]|uniref:Uncharacterized protein n=1 Tax=Ajellomyces capsulatus (strain H88) TaxID=544711 RepID=A0A8A1LCK2_AJEC8|nr:hypothetical protein I7I53_07658 [Histoplasma capsulatum var. duboisii H88]